MKNIEKNSNKSRHYQTMSEFIYISLKEAIINNRLKANQRINEKEISEQFQTSRTPIREAVLRLAAEGFVQINTYRRATVKEISYEELKEIYQVLGALDRLAVSIAVDNITSESIKKLEQILIRMEKNNDIDSIEKYLELNKEFHDEIWSAVDNKFLLETLLSVREKVMRYNYVQIYAFKRPGALNKSLNQHKELIQAIINRDKPRLMSLIVKHRASLWDFSVFSDGIKESSAEQRN